jgi:hypothetical protein
VVGAIEEMARWGRLLLRPPQRGGSLHASGALGPVGAVRVRAACWPSRTGRAADRELEPTSFFCNVGSTNCDDATTWTTPTCQSNPPPRWARHCSTSAPTTGLH